jgi:chromosome segregation ATPase
MTPEETHQNIEVRIARTEREYERLTNATFIARSRLKSLSIDKSMSALEVARARAHLERLEKKRASVRETLDELEGDPDS